MREIEVKILEIDVLQLRKKLRQMGARKIFDGKLHVAVFDTKDSYFKKTGQYLRLRTVGNKVELCFKGRNTSKTFKIREETEVFVEDFDKTTKILQNIGFKKIHNYYKHRESYKLRNAKIDLDTYPGIPTFVEIEAPSEKEVKAVVKKLGYMMKDTTNISASELFKKYKVGGHV